MGFVQENFLGIWLLLLPVVIYSVILVGQVSSHVVKIFSEFLISH